MIIAALLLALSVTRHTNPAGEVCMVVGGINPQAYSVRIRPVGDPGWNYCAIAPGTDNFYCPYTAPRENIEWFEVGQCYPMACTPNSAASGSIICGDCREPSVPETPLCCLPVTPDGKEIFGGCNVEMYPVCGP